MLDTGLLSISNHLRKSKEPKSSCIFCPLHGHRRKRVWYIEFDKNKRLAYTWQFKDIPDFPETIVTWELEQLGKNKTRVTLTHSGFTGRETGKATAMEHNQGWSFFLNELVSYCKKK